MLIRDDSPGGDCVLTTAPATGETLLIVGSTPQTQEAEILNLGGFYPRVINAALDKLTMAVQEMQAEIDRSIKSPSLLTMIQLSFFQKLLAPCASLFMSAATFRQRPDPLMPSCSNLSAANWSTLLRGKPDASSLIG